MKIIAIIFVEVSKKNIGINKSNFHFYALKLQ